MNLLLLLLLPACADRDGDGRTRREGDCDDRDVDVRPTAPEICGNGIDDDCDGLVDGEDDDGLYPVPGWKDLDGDGYAGTPAAMVCDVPAFTESTDCDDFDPAVSPAAVEVCDDGIDNNCDGGTRECEGIALSEDISGADAAYFWPTPGGYLSSEALVAGRCGDLDGNGGMDVAVLLSVTDEGPYDYYGTSPPVGTWLTLAVFDAAARGSFTPADAWARPIDERETAEVGLWGNDLLCVGDTSGDARSELVFATAGVGSLGRGVHVLAAPDRGDLSPEVRATWTFPGSTDTSLAVAAAGDVDGDGAADIFAVRPYGASNLMELDVAFLLPGSAEGARTQADALLTISDFEDQSGVGRCAGEDADGDGVGDVAIGAREVVYLFSGVQRGKVTLDDANVALAGEKGSSFAQDLAWLADSEVGTARLLVYDGVAGGSRAVGLYDLRGGALELTASVVGADELEPWEARPVGDVDSDGVVDLGVRVYDGVLFIGAPREGSVDLADARMGLTEWVQVVAAGDVDGDGDGDVLAGFWDDWGEGYAGLWLGGPPQ